MGVDQVAVVSELEQCAPVKIERLDDPALSLLDRGSDLGRRKIDEPHRQFPNELLEWEPVRVRRAEGMVQHVVVIQVGLQHSSLIEPEFQPVQQHSGATAL